MIPDWAYMAAITALLTVIGILWKLHLDSDARERAVAVASHNEAMIEVVKDRDEWKAIAKAMVTDVGELGEALAVRNRIDEELRRVGVVKVVAT